MENKTTLTNINEVMTMLNGDSEAITLQWTSFERKFKEIFGFKPNQTLTAYDVVCVVHRYINGNGGKDDSNKN